VIQKIGRTFFERGPPAIAESGRSKGDPSKLKRLLLLLVITRQGLVSRPGSYRAALRIKTNPRSPLGAFVYRHSRLSLGGHGTTQGAWGKWEIDIMVAAGTKFRQ